MKCDKCGIEPRKNLWGSDIATAFEHYGWSWCPWCVERELQEPDQIYAMEWLDVIQVKNIGTMRPTND